MPEQKSKLKRTLGLAEATFFGVGSILGAGIYAVIGEVAGMSGNMIWLSFLIASVTALLSALSYAEISSMFPKAGGEYVYTKNGFPKIAVVIGLLVSFTGIMSGATVAVGFAGYFSELIGFNETLAALGVVALVGLVNISGIRQSSWMNILFTVVEFGGLVLVVYAAAPKVGSIDYLELPPDGFNAVMLGAALSYFAFVGFEEIVKLSEETKKPEKNIPRALFIAITIVIVVYLIVSVCAVSAMNWKELGDTKNPLAAIVENRLGAIGVTVVSIIALFATTNTILSNMLGSSRVLMEMGRDYKLIERFASVSRVTKTPVIALIIIAGLMAALSLVGRLEVLALVANFFVFTAFITVNLIVIKLRITDKDLKRPYKVPLSISNIPVTAVIAVLLTLVLFGYSIYGVATS